MTDDILAKHILRMAAKADQNNMGKSRPVIREPIRNAQALSSIELTDKRVLPHKYQAMYNRLLDVDPKRAYAYWQKHAYVPLTDAERKVIAQGKLKAEQLRKAGEALARVQRGNELKRRV